MSKESSQTTISNLPQRLEGLSELAYNLWWSWHPEAKMLFKMLDRQAWKESLHNPVKLLKELPRATLESAAKDPDFQRYYDAVMAKFRAEIAADGGWFTQGFNGSTSLPIVYLSAEYGLHHSLPFFAGGLGFLAGDHIKECNDLGVPLVAVGFMYPKGYLRQEICADGWQADVDQTIDRESAPITKVLDKNGSQLTVRVPFIDPPIYVAVWKVMAGKIPLYLMGTDIELNDPWNRSISSRLYAADTEQRLRQEIVLGIGACEVLSALGIRRYALHLNEGHPAFAILERIRRRVADNTSYDQAARETTATTIFTTHSPVAAAHDVFPFPLMDKYFSKYYLLLGLNRDGFLRLGAHPDYPDSGFNMTVFALKMSAYHNAVSRRHGEVARGLWQSLWPDLKPENVPLGSITNGVHVPTWLQPKIGLLFDNYIGPRWLAEHDDDKIWEAVDNIPDKELWQVHYWMKVKLINFIREQSRRRWVDCRVNPNNVLAGGALLDPSALTIGFARRFASYKRAGLIFQDMPRLKKMVNDRWRPVQIVFAGKAHPADDYGKRILQQVFNFAHDPELGGRVAFVENYDEQLAQYMVHGVDIWLNNPLPPQEASGTSGMKAAINGVPNLSILDGWWAEGFNGNNGWAFGQKAVQGNRDWADAQDIYRILEEEIIPLYYKPSDDGFSHEWIRLMKESIKSNIARFSTRRMVKEYVCTFYVAALKAA